MTARRFPPPWTVGELDPRFVVKDSFNLLTAVWGDGRRIHSLPRNVLGRTERQVQTINPIGKFFHRRHPDTS
jgi:hypothetical protein